MSRSSLRRAVLVAMILGSTALSAPPLAATEVTVATPDGAALLADSLMDGIKRWLPPTPEGGGPEWGGDGKAKAEVDGDAYRVTLPALTLRTEDESRLLVGEIVMSLKPLAGGDWQLLETRLPGEIPVVDAGRKRQATLTLAQPALTGRWSARFETFLDMDARLNGARLTGIQDKAGLSLGPVTVKTGYTPQDDERWNGTSTVSLR
ncbi:MAG TPA: hypothetical protein VEB64_10840, partial [Azospirillaceae bacterium]|nr:hypothetical protein [Azospirillaceae bacterium]